MATGTTANEVGRAVEEAERVVMVVWGEAGRVEAVKVGRAAVVAVRAVEAALGHKRVPADSQTTKDLDSHGDQCGTSSVLGRCRPASALSFSSAWSAPICHAQQ